MNGPVGPVPPTTSVCTVIDCGPRRAGTWRSWRVTLGPRSRRLRRCRRRRDSRGGRGPNVASGLMLSPYRVLDLTDERGHFAGLILARLGADVVAVEPPGGSPARRPGPLGRPTAAPSPYLAFNRGKRSVELDLDHRCRPGPAAAPGRRRRRPDRVGGAGRAGGARPRRRRPGRASTRSWSWSRSPPFGRRGPKADWPATDLTVWAASGSMALVRRPRPGPARAVRAPGLPPRRRPGRGGGRPGPARAGPLGPGPARRRVGTDRLPCRPPSRARAEQLRPGPAGRPLRRRAWAAATSSCASSTRPLDGHVSITHVFGAAVGPATRRLMELRPRGGLLRRGHPGQGLGQLRRAAERRFGAAERARPGPGLRQRAHLGADQGRAVRRSAARAGC